VPPAFPWAFSRAEQMGASEVSRIAFAIGRRLSQLGAQVGEWLRGINLGQYAVFVVENEVDGYTLLDLVKVTRPQLNVELWLAFVSPVSFLRPGPANRRTASSPSASSASSTSRSSAAASAGVVGGCGHVSYSDTILSVSTFKEHRASTDMLSTAQATA
jgi:hypothetical protein